MGAARLLPGRASDGVQGIKWVDSRTLGGLHERNPLLGIVDHPEGRAVMATADAINSAPTGWRSCT